MNRNIRRLSLLSGLAVVAVGLYLAQRSSASPPPKDGALRIKLEPKDLVIEIIDTGKVQPKEKIEVKSKVAGQVTALKIDAGYRVRKGDLLLELDPTDYQRDVARAEAEVAQAKNAVEFAQLTLDRKNRGLEGRGVAQTDVDFAANELKSKRVAQKSAEILEATARDRLRYTRILAPIDGTVMELNIQQGEVVTPGVQQTFEGRALLTIGDLSALIVRAELNQIDIAKIALGQRATLTLDALPGQTFTAEVTKIAPAAVKPKGKEVEVFPVEATLSAPVAAIKPGMTADVRFLVDTRPQTLSVPIEAVLKEAGKNYLTMIVEKEGREEHEKREVQLGARSDREVEITSGAAAGETILINPGSSAANEVAL